MVHLLYERKLAGSVGPVSGREEDFAWSLRFHWSLEIGAWILHRLFPCVSLISFVSSAHAALDHSRAARNHRRHYGISPGIVHRAFADRATVAAAADRF